MTSPTPRSLRTLLGRAIDYAGLFPPAGLPMQRAVLNYGTYRASEDAWALGRFVCGAGRLPELAAALDARDESEAGDGWRVSATLGEDWPADRARVLRFNRRSDARVDAIEAPAAAAASVRELASLLDEGFFVYGEVHPAAPDLAETIGALASAGLAAKLRLGGVTPDRFPAAEPVAAFLLAVARAGLRFKATAGLHHALRGEYPLTYEPDSPTGTMYGYLNVLLAAIVAGQGGDLRDVVAALEERAPGAIDAADDGLAWRDLRVDLAGLERFRERFDGFGSCSFREPIEALPLVTRP